MPVRLNSIFSRDTARKARSSALNSLQWYIGMILAALPALVIAKAPEWLLICVIVGFALVGLVFLGGFVFLLMYDRDALRSEDYSLSKLAIEKGLVGDNVAGLMDGQLVVDSPAPLRIEGNGDGAKP